MGKIDISLIVAFSFTPTALLKPCSLICPFFCLLPFFSRLSLFVSLFFFTFFYDLQTFSPSFLPSLSVSVSLTNLLLSYVRRFCINSVGSHAVGGFHIGAGYDTQLVTVPHCGRRCKSCTQFHILDGLRLHPPKSITNHFERLL